MITNKTMMPTTYPCHILCNIIKPRGKRRVSILVNHMASSLGEPHLLATS